MILTRAPLRITLGGGGTDVKAYYERHGGVCLAGAIDRYVYITVHRTFVPELIVKYSKLERVESAEELEHPIIREAMALCQLDGRGMEITSMADIHAGTGLGSSGAFTVALLKALHCFKREIRSAHQLAEEACEIEINRLREPIGKQDQFIAAYGGVTRFRFNHDGVTAEPVPGTDDIEEHLLLFFTGHTRSASEVLAPGYVKMVAQLAGTIASLDRTKTDAHRAYNAFSHGDPQALGIMFHEHWQEKREQPGMSNAAIDGIYAHAMANGAIGGKLVGAGGGGFFLFVAEDKTRLRRAMRETKCPEVKFRFDFEGVRLL